MYIWDMLVNGFLASYLIHHRLRKMILNMLGCEIGEESAVHSRCCITGSHLYLGKHSYINRHCLLDAKHGSVYIGDCVGIAYNAKLLTTCHIYDSSEKRTGKVYGKDIRIGDGCWIGAGAIICPGVSIGKGCVIAAGSVVVEDCEECFLYGGNPAKKIKKIMR